MRRRTVLRTIGITATAGIAGCLGGDSGGTANEFDYETTVTAGVEVPLVPIADAIDWYRADDAVFADARSRTAYNRAHITDAVLSPAPDGLASDDPVEERDTDARIVTYCACPHHLSTQRAASLIEDGYTQSYAIDEGFRAWIDKGYPVEGSAVNSLPDAYEIAGRTDDSYAGDSAWARHGPSGQREATEIAADGTFTLHLRFYEIDRESRIEVETPAGAVTRPLGRLLDGTVEI